MINVRENVLRYLVLIFVNIKLLGAEEVPSTSSNQGNSLSSVQPRFSDLGAMGFPNFGSAGFGNPTSNYPMNSFFPFGNQNNNRQPQLGPGLGLQNPNPNEGNFQNRPIQLDYNQQRYPYQGDNVNPSTNYQRPPYTPNEGSIYPNQNNNQGNFPNRPIQGDFANQGGFPYQGDSMNPYPNYQQPQNSNSPADASMYPGNINRPYQNGRTPNQGENFNQPMLLQGRPWQTIQYPIEGTQYPSQGNFQGNRNPNLRPDQMSPNFRPDDLNNLPKTNIQFPDKPHQNQPNQYYPQNGLPNQNNQNFRPGFDQPDNYQPLNGNPNSSIQFPTGISMGENGNSSTIQFPNQGGTVNMYPPGSTLNQGAPNQENFINIPQNQPQSPNNQGMGSTYYPDNNNNVAILGKPVIVPPITQLPGQIVYDNSSESPTQTKCVQDCQSTSEYDPVCGTNNVTYINPGKFVCARNCGVVVYLQKQGRCDGDVPSFYARQ